MKASVEKRGSRIFRTKESSASLASGSQVDSVPPASSIDYLAIENSIQENVSSIRFGLNCHKVVYRTISYRGVCWLMRYEDRMK